MNRGSTAALQSPGRAGAAPAPEPVDAVVIGGGVVGCAILRELAIRGVDAILLEAEPDIGEGASKANSAILHTGFDAKPGTIEARLLRRAGELWPELLEELGVPALACGALMLARSEAEAGGLAEIAALATANGVATETIAGADLRDLAPYLTPHAAAALHVPGEGIVDPFWLTRAFAESAIAAGAAVRRRARVIAVDVGADGVDIRLTDGSRLRARQAFDAAGLWADEVATLAGDTSFRLTPRKGQFLVSELTGGVDRIVLPIPGPLGKGMLVTPIVFGGVLLGPTAEDGTDKLDRSTDDAGQQRILESCRALVPAADEMVPIRRFAGVRAVSSTGDYVIRASTAGDRLTIVAGIRSTGISASPAIAELAVDIASASRGWQRRPGSRGAAVSADGGLAFAEDAGAVVCVCRSVSAAEVALALAGPVPATTTDAVKRRCGAGFGDCQGNRCLAEVIDRVAIANGIAPTVVEKGLAGSWLVARAAPAGAGSTATADVWPSRADEPFDVLVVGAGPAGIASAIACAEAGLDVGVVERGSRPGGWLLALAASSLQVAEHAALGAFHLLATEGRISFLPSATVVGLASDADASGSASWNLDVQMAAGSRRVEAAAVVLATGGYVTPREQVGVDGARPAGVMTADFVSDALDRGWLPTRRAVVIGDGRLAQAISGRLRDAGAEIAAGVRGAGANEGDRATTTARVAAIRGLRRVEAVRLAERDIEADAIVFADGLQPSSFLLRGLGIGDDRPGVPMPADGAGALPPSGLWAAGTCVVPDVDHASSLENGRRVGTAVAAHVAVGARR
ncbi:MAG TPA: FAD-dependent oxidoreductase [Candidatus Limnocylindrales bacterium]|nr:FAD-dependent oxidoreductase [Candidatus Limnocylindrales bacterium]